MSDILFLNHNKSQCGVYEIGKRIYGLISPYIPMDYFEIPNDCPQAKKYLDVVDKFSPNKIIYNYYPGTMPWLNCELMSYTRADHYAIIHDPLDPGFIQQVTNSFRAWMIHDQTNMLPSRNKFKTFRPIPRFENKNPPTKMLTIGSHGFNISPWKMFDKMISIINEQVSCASINFNITNATFGGGGINDRIIDQWRKLITKKDIYLNVTTEYFPEESDVINFLAKNTINMYFYNPPHPFIGVGGSADLAVAAQTSLVVNDTYMYRHLHEKLGFYNNDLLEKTHNRSKVIELYNEWNPEAIAKDYKDMLQW